MSRVCAVGLVLLAACAVQAETLSFDGGEEPAPVKSEKVAFVKGLSGRAAHLGRDSFLEYPTAIPEFMTPTSGTFMAWFRHDRTIPSSHAWRDRNRDGDGDLPLIMDCGEWQRNLFASGRSSIGAGILCRGEITSIPGPGNYWGRRVLGGEWHFLAISYDSNAGRVLWHADGMVMSTNVIDGWRRASFGKTFTLGSGGGRLGFEGSIDEVRFLPVALGEDDFRKEYLKYQPVRYELHDWSVGEGETKAFRFRARNESASTVEKNLSFSIVVGDNLDNGGQRSHAAPTGAAEVVPSCQSCLLSLASDEVKEFTVDVKGGKPGLFTLWLNEGEPDARQFECICLEREGVKDNRDNRGQHEVVSSCQGCLQPVKGKRALIGEYDCTKTYPTDRVALCASEVVTNGALAYLESRDYRTAIPLSAYRFRIRHQGRPHIVELDYPDDKIRSFVFGVYSEKWGRLLTKTIDCAGVMTGIDYPLSMEMQTKQLVFWPDSETVSVVVQNYKNKGGYRVPPMQKSEYGEHPAACAAVRMYEMDSLEPGPVQGMSEKKRTVAVWDEDPTIDADLTFGKSFDHDRADLEFWRVKWQRTIDYMRWNSMDSWVIKVVNYNGDATAMDATMPEAALPWNSLSYNNGRCRGWAELGADMLCRAGMGFWVRINHRDRTGWFTRLGGAAPDGGEKKCLDLRNPAVRKAYLRLVAAYRDKFGRFSGFRGVMLNEELPVFYPGGQDEMELFARELAATIREKGGNAEVQVWVSALTGFLDAKWDDWNPGKRLMDAGLDARTLSGIPGIRVVPYLRPDDYRHRMGKTVATDEPYLYNSPSWIDFVRDSGIDCINVARMSNFEIYPHMGIWEDAVNPWKSELWLPTFNIVDWSKDFQCYATPHARPPYTLDSVASLIADIDVQDFLTGFWGIVESGEHDEWRRFYGQFRQIPRGRYALAKGPDDPVAVRSGAEGHYLVNREPYPVKVEYVVDGNTETLILRHHEIRFANGRGSNGAVEVRSAKIPTAERATHLANLEKLEAAAKADEKNATLSRAAKEARAAFDEGRFHQFRALFLLGEVRKVFHPEVFPEKK